MKEIDKAFKLRNELEEFLRFNLIDHRDRLIASFEYVGDDQVRFNGEEVELEDLVELAFWILSLKKGKKDLCSASSIKDQRVEWAYQDETAS